VGGGGGGGFNGADNELTALPRQALQAMSAGEEAEAASDPPSTQALAPEAAPANDGLDIPTCLRRCLRCNLPGNADRPVTKDRQGRWRHDACRIEGETMTALWGKGH